MVRGLWLPIADHSIEPAGSAVAMQADGPQPIGNTAPYALGALYVPVHDHRAQPAFELLLVMPTIELDLLREHGIFALRACWIGIATIGTYQAIHHQFEW